MFDRLVHFFTSLRLTVGLLALAIVLVFWGTLAQVNLGLYKAQNEFFRSFFIFCHPVGSSLKIPIFPGGYLVGGLLLINLLAAHARYSRPEKRKIGISLIHLGVVLLLIGQLLADLLSTESSLHLREGQTLNYSQIDSLPELAVVEVTRAQADQVFVFPQRQLQPDAKLQHPLLPFTLGVKWYYPNSVIAERQPGDPAAPAASQGLGPQMIVHAAPLETQMNRRNLPSAVVELITPGSSLGTWLVSLWMDRPQSVRVGDREFQLSLRPTRLYKNYSITLEKFTHEVYPGTQIPKDFSSLVRVRNPGSGEDRQVRIYMNNPLRYAGETYYQASFDTDDKGTILQVVRNPGWLTPYVSCVLVSLGLAWQFLMHLIPFLKRKGAS